MLSLLKVSYSCVLRMRVYNRTAMELLFNLYWVREGASDRGTRVSLDELEPVIQERILQAVNGDPGVFDLKLPFLDRREVRRRSEVLSQLHFERRGQEISALLTPRFALRTAAAEIALHHPAWPNSPSELDA